MPLTLAEQRRILKALPAKHKTALRKHCRDCEQGGAGFFDVVKKAGNWLVATMGPIAREVGPTVLKEFILPMLKEKTGLDLRMRKKKKPAATPAAGSGLRPMGSGLRPIGGTRGRGKRKK